MRIVGKPLPHSFNYLIDYWIVAHVVSISFFTMLKMGSDNENSSSLLPICLRSLTAIRLQFIDTSCYRVGSSLRISDIQFDIPSLRTGNRIGSDIGRVACNRYDRSPV